MTKSCSNIILEHSILIRSFEQIVHQGGQFFGERLKEQSVGAYTLLEDLKDGIYVVGLHLKYRLSKSLHEVP